MSDLFADSKTDETYKIGDTGPGGGLIFHVEGGRYMEVSHILGTYKWNKALNVARNYKGGRFTDWRLPTKEELNQIYVNLKKSGKADLGNTRHWSSSELNFDDSGWFQNFDGGNQSTCYKHYAYSVRAVRAF
jgi:hypothetical protein